MRYQIIFTAVLSALWILLGSWFVGSYMAPKSIVIPSLVVQDEQMMFESDDHYWFKAGSEDLEVGDDTRIMLQEITDYLTAHPNRKVVLAGRYMAEELNNTAYQNLGIARAEALRVYLQELGLPAPQMETDFELVNEIKLADGLFYDAVKFDFKPIFTEDPAEYPGEDAPMANEEIEPLIIYGDAIQNLSMNPSLMHFIEKIQAHQTEFPNRKIMIVGHAEQDANVNRAITNSKMNAGEVKSFFVQNGIKTSMIKWEGKGASEPMVGPKNPDAPTRNNRVEISIMED